jgi:hypothetical protein
MGKEEEEEEQEQEEGEREEEKEKVIFEGWVSCPGIVVRI